MSLVVVVGSNGNCNWPPIIINEELSAPIMPKWCGNVGLGVISSVVCVLESKDWTYHKLGLW